MPKRTVSDNYCPMRAFQLGIGAIRFPEEHTTCGKKRCWAKANSKGVFVEEDEPQVCNLFVKIIGEK
jgi:hypothetical protein